MPVRQRCVRLGAFELSVYVNVRCGSCGRSLTSGYVANYFAIGSPVIECHTCGALNSHADKCTEWALMSPLRRLWLFVLVMFTGAFWATGMFFAIFIGIMAINDDISEGAIITIAVASLLASYLYRFFQIRRLIRQSNERMNDHLYRLRLSKLGMAI